MKRRRIITIISLVIVFGIILFPKKQEYSASIPDALGTFSEIRIYSKNDKPLSECVDYIYKMDNLLSATNPESEISKLNSHQKTNLSPETQELLNLSLSYTDSSTFNPFCGTLISLWENAKKNGTPPESSEIILAASYSYPPSLKTEKETGILENPDQEINLGAIAKGYITDKLVEILDSQKVDSALIYLGGNVYAKGLNKNGEKWRIGVSSPDNSGDYIGILSVSDLAVITSGDYERYFEFEGKRYHHILNPTTGYPAESGLKSVTIVTPNATLGDMLSTRCFVAGFDASKDILKEYNAYGIFITSDNKIYYSEELKGIFSYEDSDYSYIEF